MAETYQGLYVKFGADTVEFDNSVKGMNKALTGLKKDINNLKKQLKFDPDNVDLLTRKLENFEEQARVGALKIQELRKQQSELGSEKVGTAEWNKLELEISKVETQMKSVEKASQATAKRIKDVSDPESVYNLDKAIAEVGTDLDIVNRKLQLNPDDVELTTQKMKLLGQQTQLADKKITSLKNEQSKLGSENVGTDEWKKLQRAIGNAEIQAGEFKKELDNIGSADGLDEVSSSLEAMANLNIAESIGEASGKLLELGGSAVSASADIQGAVFRITGYFGETGEKAQETEEVFKEVFSSGITDSADEAAEAVRLVKENISGLNAEDMSNISQQVLSLDQNFDVDMSESLRGVNSLMTNFGLTADDAMDLLVAGTQNGLNKTNELGDNLAEYAPKFKQAGFSAEEMFTLLQNGLKGGAYNLDKVNDSINEMTTRLADGTIGDNISDFSKKTQELFKSWEDGDKNISQKDIFESIVKDISNTTNKQKKLNMAANAFGTMAEDGGTQFIESLTAVNGAFDETKGKADEFQKSSVGLKEQLTSVKNNTSLLASELGKQLAPVLEPITNAINAIIKAFLEAPEPVKQIITAVLSAITIVMTIIGVIAAVKLAISGIATVLGGLLAPAMVETGAAAGVASTGFGALSTSLLPIIAIVVGITLAIAGIILLIKNWGKITEWIGKVMSSVWNGIKNTCSKAWNGLKNIFSKGVKSVVSVVSNIKEKIAQKFSGLKEAIKGRLGNLAEIGKMILNGILNGLTNIGSAIKNKIVNGLKNAKKGLGSIAGRIFGKSYGGGGYVPMDSGGVMPLLSAGVVKAKDTTMTNITNGGASTTLNISVTANNDNAEEIARAIERNIVRRITL